MPPCALRSCLPDLRAPLLSGGKKGKVRLYGIRSQHVLMPRRDSGHRERPGAASHCLPVYFPSQAGLMPDAAKAGACFQICLKCFRSISTPSTYQESNSFRYLRGPFSVILAKWRPALVCCRLTVKCFHELLCLDTVLLFYRCTRTHIHT